MTQAEMQALFDADRLVIDAPETVTLVRLGVGTATPTVRQSVPNAQARREPTSAAGTSAAILESTITSFHLWAADLAGTVPLKGHKIETADGTSYNVMRVDKANFGRRFACEVRKDRLP